MAACNLRFVTESTVMARLSRPAAAALTSQAASAVPVYSVSSPTGQYGLAPCSVVTGAAGVTNSTNNLHAIPVGLTSGGSYYYVTPNAGAITVDVNASSFAFLWGSPDAANVVTYHTTFGN